ncbi:MAG: peptide chain release factor 2 [Dehalococcoidia bacterium]|nr:peptide chain release factor 2 [Dehalococcoidia bacterium]
MSWCVFDIPGEERLISELEQQTAEPDFWKDQRSAKSLMRTLTGKKSLVSAWKSMQSEAQDLLGMVELALAEDDESVKDDLASETAALVARFEKQETALLLSGEYDDRNALVALHAGAGGTESQDWASMLLRMYVRWAERQGYTSELLDISEGDEAGLKSAFLSIEGDHAYGYLRGERGVHRLVRLSPFDADHARHTSFALVEVLPEAEAQVDIDIPAGDLKIETYRSSGPGGQNMQKVSSAVRITHLPTGLVATCQSQRSQHQNKDVALQILYARVLELQRKEKDEERAKLKGDRVDAGWGNQIRSYVLHPYKMVKDHRTGFESSAAEAVLDGALDDFVASFLRSKVGEV